MNKTIARNAPSRITMPKIFYFLSLSILFFGSSVVEAQEEVTPASSHSTTETLDAVQKEKLERLKSERDTAEIDLVSDVETAGWLDVINILGVGVSCCGFGLMVGGFSAGGTSNIYYGSGASLALAGSLTVVGSYLWRLLVLDIDQKTRTYKAKQQDFDNAAMAF